MNGGAALRVPLPEGARTGLPVFSHDGRRFAFARDLADGVELWVGRDRRPGAARPVPASASTTSSARRSRGRDEARSSCGRSRRTAARRRGRRRCPSARVVEETAGKASQMATFQDLLRTPHDAALFEHYARTQLAVVDVAAGTAVPLGEPGLYTDAEPSPDGRYLLVERVKAPFSTRVPYFYFARATEVWDAAGSKVATVADLPVSDEIPRQGEPTGPRAIAWQPLVPATLVWLEALDGGDPHEEGAAPRARDDARRPLRRGALRGDAARAALRRPRLDRPPGRGPRHGVRPGPPLAHHVARGPRGARVREGPLRPLGQRRLRRPGRAGDADAAERRARRPPGRRRDLPRRRRRVGERATGRSSTASRSRP